MSLLSCPPPELLLGEVKPRAMFKTGEMGKAGEMGKTNKMDKMVEFSGSIKGRRAFALLPG